jgi:sulfofructose kinase
MSTLDVLIRLGEMPTWERGARIEGFSLDGGGPVGTACVAASRLGARTGFVGIAGNDVVAELKLQSLRENGVDTSRVAIRDRPETQVVIVYVNEDTGERIFSRLRRFGDDPLTPAELDREYLTSAAWLHLDGSHTEAAIAAAQWMHEAGKQVAIDCGKTDATSISSHLRELLRHVDVLICGQGFGRALTGHTDPWTAGEAALAFGPDIVVQTEGVGGSYSVSAEERFHTPAFEVEVLDTTGAGDVFHGAYLVGLLRGWPLETIAQFASAVAALKCTHLGGRRGIPSFEETAAFLEARGLGLPSA